MVNARDERLQAEASLEAHSGEAWEDAGEAAQEPAAHFMCPRCVRPELVAVLGDDVGAAECRACAYREDDLLRLVPVSPVGLLRLVVGGGAAAYLRVVAYLLVCGLFLAIVLVGR